MKYIAMLRGIGPGNPQMRNDKLRSVFDSLGFSDVRSVISSGNIIFSSPRKSIRQLEEDIETSIETQLGFHSTTIIRSASEIEALVKLQPFSEAHSQKAYSLVTFLKTSPTTIPMTLPYNSPDGVSAIIEYDKASNAVFSVSDATSTKTPDVMRRLEKEFGKDITSRSWNTVQRIYKKFDKE